MGLRASVIVVIRFTNNNSLTNFVDEILNFKYFTFALFIYFARLSFRFFKSKLKAVGEIAERVRELVRVCFIKSKIRWCIKSVIFAFKKDCQSLNPR